jgi:multicomponent K+:H+ antiporter subunit E
MRNLLLPRPLVTLALLAMWLVLNDSIGVADLLLGTLAGMAGGALYARLGPSGARLGRVVVPAASLALLVLDDIVRSNVAVLRIVAGAGTQGRVSGFLAIPLELRDKRGLAILACIVTATPGTAWAHFEAETNVLTLHVLDLRDDEAWVRQFKDRYETRLMEIFP